MEAALEAAKEPSFLARLTLVDPRTMAPEKAKSIAHYLDRLPPPPPPPTVSIDAGSSLLSEHAVGEGLVGDSEGEGEGDEGEGDEGEGDEGEGEGEGQSEEVGEGSSADLGGSPSQSPGGSPGASSGTGKRARKPKPKRVGGGYSRAGSPGRKGVIEGGLFSSSTRSLSRGGRGSGVGGGSGGPSGALDFEGSEGEGLEGAGAGAGAGFGGSGGHGGRGGGGGGADAPARVVVPDEAAKAITELLRQALVVDPNVGMLANAVRPLAVGPRLSLHTSRTSGTQFPVAVRGEDGSVLSTRPELPLASMASRSNPFYDPGVLAYYAKAGGATPPTPFSKRKVLAAAAWYVHMAPVWPPRVLCSFRARSASSVRLPVVESREHGGRPCGLCWPWLCGFCLCCDVVSQPRWLCVQV